LLDWTVRFSPNSASLTDLNQAEDFPPLGSSPLPDPQIRIHVAGERKEENENRYDSFRHICCRQLAEKTGGKSPITFMGLPGSTDTANHIRLYQDTELISFVEIPVEAVLDSKQEDGGVALVRCRRDMEIRVGAVATANADVLFSGVEPPPEMKPLDSPSPTPTLTVPKPPTICSMSVRWRTFLKKVWVDGGIHIIPMAVPFFILDCR
jgi:hypothetical protein